MIGCQMAASSREAMHRLEMCVNRRLWARVREQAVDVMMTSEVGDNQAGRRHEQDRSGMVAWDHAEDGSRLVVVVPVVYKNAPKILNI